jgi:cytochrome c
MTFASLIRPILALGVLAALVVAGPVQAAADAAAAQQLARKNNCLKCHGTDKAKEGPALKDIAAKYKDKDGAEQRLYTHLTTGEKAKFPDGHEEEHKVLKAPDAEIKNLIRWILEM